MLRTIREYSQSIFVYAIFGVLVFVFAVSFGPNSSSCGASNTDFAARVNGDIIARAEYSARLAQQVRRFGGNLSAKQITQLGINKRVIDSMIENRLLAQQATSRGLQVEDDELVEHLAIAYGVKGISLERYESFVRQTFNTTVPRFEARVRDEIKASKISELVRKSVSVSDEELKTEYWRQRNRAKVTFIRFDAEENAGLDRDQVLNAEALAAALTEDEALTARYEKDKFTLYHTDKRVKARQILKKVSSDASPGDVAAAKTALVELKTRLDRGEDFAALAKEYSEDSASKDSGGDIGYIVRGQRAADLVDAVFALQVDGITAEPVKTRQGWHLLQATEVVPPEDKPLDEVREQVAKSVLLSRGAEARAMAEAGNLLKKLIAGESLTDLTWTSDDESNAKDKARQEKTAMPEPRPIRKQSEWLQKGQETMATFGKDAAMHSAIFARDSLDEGGLWVDQTFANGKWVYILHLDSRELPQLEKFENTKESLRDGAITDKQRQVHQAWLQHLRGRAQVELNQELFPPSAGGIDLSQFKLGG